MKEKDDPWYPTYCDDLITKHDETPIDVNFASADIHSYTAAPGSQATSRSPGATKRLPEEIIGWGWSEWGEWGDGGCPEICGRRCNRRSRFCTGPYHLICKGRGKCSCCNFLLNVFSLIIFSKSFDMIYGTLKL